MHSCAADGVEPCCEHFLVVPTVLWAYQWVSVQNDDGCSERRLKPLPPDKPAPLATRCSTTEAQVTSFTPS